MPRLEVRLKCQQYMYIDSKKKTRFNENKTKTLNLEIDSEYINLFKLLSSQAYVCYTLFFVLLREVTYNIPLIIFYVKTSPATAAMLG